jgi:Tfp pilus assembly protein PilF
VVAAQLALHRLYREAKAADKLLGVLGWVAGQAGNLNALGDELQALNKDPPLVAALVKAAQARKDSLEFGEHLAAAILAMEAKDHRTAGAFFDAAIDARAESAADVLQTWGVSLLRADRWAEAGAVFQRGIDEGLSEKDDPSMLHYWLSFAQEMAGQTEAALATAKAGIALAPADPRILARVPWIQYHGKQYDAAKAGYAALIKKFESDPKLRESPAAISQVRQARLSLSNIAVHEHDLPAAEEWLEQVLDDAPDDVGAQNDLGYLWADQNKHLDRALRMIRRAVESEPDNMAYLDSMGWVLYRLGDYEGAVEWLRKAAASTESPDGVILDHLADAYAKAGQAAEARATWQRALERFEKDKETDKAEATKRKLGR